MLGEYRKILELNSCQQIDRYLNTIESHKILNKIDKKILREFLVNTSHKLFSLISQINYNETKSFLCNVSNLESFMYHSNRMNEIYNEQDWSLLTASLKCDPMKSLIDLSVRKCDMDFYNYDKKFSKEMQDLPENFVRLGNSVLLTPKNRSFIKRFSVYPALDLCTIYHVDLIGKNHKKVLVLDNEYNPIAFVTIYKKANCYAISGKNNAHLDEEIEKEILDYFSKNEMINSNSFRIDRQDTYNIVNNYEEYDKEKINFLKESLESELIKHLFPDFFHST